MTVTIQAKIWWMDQQPSAYFMQKNPPITDDFYKYFNNLSEHDLRIIMEKILDDRP